MKKINIYLGIGLISLSGAVSSCSSDYLDQPPITTISDSQIGESIEAARAALYGLCQAMYCGFYNDYSDRSNCGEPWFQTYYGDAGSPDFWDTFLWGYQYSMQNWVLMLRNSAYGSRNGWMYGYNLIGQANNILVQLDNIPASQQEIDFVKAQCLTMRAHGYVRLMQLYAPRFEDTNGGKELCVILKDKPGLDPLPLSTYQECIDFIYKDLDTAISLYQSSGGKRSFGYEPDLSVAQGIYSRIALLNHDWAKASEMAEAARKNYPIMTPDAYRQGFADPTSEWMWYNDPDMTYVGYMSWGANYSCNGAYCTAYNWSGAGCISFRLYDQIYERYPDDVRCELFWTPDKANKYVDLGIKREDFWNPKMVNTEYGYMYGLKMNENMSAAVSLFSRHMNPNPDLFTESAFNVDISLTDAQADNMIERRKWYNGLPKATVNVCQPGAQVKFWSYPADLYASSHPFLRASELLLTQAEAEYELGNQTEARELLTELNSKRISNYSCYLSGESLRDEIRLYRRMELWGEGDCWFSFKRWNLKIERYKWIENDPTSDTFWYGYFPGSDEDAASADPYVVYEPDYGKGWRFLIPTSETNYNPLVADQLNQ